MSEKSIFDLKLHESIWVEDSRVVRVPGGWIYWDSGMGVFVPYCNDFFVTEKERQAEEAQRGGVHAGE